MKMNNSQKSLILITVDCLRADHCGFYGYSRPTTPFLDSLANESFVVPTAVVAGAPTYYSFPAIMASRMPLALGRDVIGLAPGESTLATALHEAGYATAAVSAANPYISPRFGYDQGFETFKDFLDFDSASAPPTDSTNVYGPPLPAGPRTKLNQSLKNAAHAIGLGRIYDDLYFEYCLRVAAPAVASMDSLRKFPSAEVIVNHGIEWLASTAGRPFFLWLHLMDPHSPYYPSAATFRALTGRNACPTEARYLNDYWNRSDLTPQRFAAKRKSVLDLYDAGIRSADDQIARLVAHLKHTDRWDRCTLAVTADHGEEFLDHGSRYHAPVSLHDEIARVPLLLRVPQFEKKHEKKSENKKVPAAPFSHLHLAPTLLEILSVPAPESFEGKSLCQNLQQAIPWDDPAIAECVTGCTNPFRAASRIGPRLLSVRSERHKLVMKLEAGAAEDIFDLEKDPREESPIPVGADKDIRARLLKTAHAYLRQSARRNTTARLRARLRDIQVELGSKSR